MTFNNLYSLIHESNAVRSYSCLMLNCNFLANEIKEIQSEICPCDVYDEEPGHGLETEFHATALYGIHTDKLKEIRDKVQIKPVKIKFGKLSLFENEKYDVLKFDIISHDMVKLNKQLCENIAYTNSYKDYKCHATVSYIQHKKGKLYTSLKSKIIGKTYECNTFVFSDKLANKTYFIV